MSIALSVIVAVLAVVVIASGLVIALLLLCNKKPMGELSSSTTDFELTIPIATEKMMVDHYSSIENVTTPETKAPIYDTPNFQEQFPTGNNVAYGHFNQIA